MDLPLIFGRSRSVLGSLGLVLLYSEPDPTWEIVDGDRVLATVHHSPRAFAEEALRTWQRAVPGAVLRERV